MQKGISTEKKLSPLTAPYYHAKDRKRNRFLTDFSSLFFAASLSSTGEMIISNERYSMTENESSMYAVQMTLVIQKLHKADMGGYKCISKNSIGDAEGTIRLYGE